MTKVCFACGRRLGRNPKLVTCIDEQDVFVGTECGKLVEQSKEAGYQPPKGGPRLYDLRYDPKGKLTPAELGRRMDAARSGVPVWGGAKGTFEVALHDDTLPPS